MQKAKLLGVVGSPRKNGNTFKLVERALKAAENVSGIETKIYEMAGKKIHHCTGCLKCLDTGSCVFKDDLQDFEKRYMEADGVIWGAPVYHMAIPALMQAALERFCNYTICNFLARGKEIPRFTKVCGVLTVGHSRYGGQEMVMSYLVNSSLNMNCVVVSGDTILGNSIGAASYIGGSSGSSSEQLISKDVVLQDEKGLLCAENLGKRVAETTKIVKAGLSLMREELPDEYSYIWEGL